MKVAKTDLSPTSFKLVITADEADMSPIRRHVLRSHFSDAKVSGFREGRAPLSLIEKSVDPTRLSNEFLEHAINDLYRKAVETEGLRPFGQPNIELKKFVPYTTLEFEAVQDSIGTITLPNYKAIKLAKSETTVTTAEVQNVLENLRARIAERKPVDRAAKIGDEVSIDFKGTDTDGEAIAGADGKDYPLVLGSNSFIPGFEEKIIGLKPGSKKEFKITFPKNYGIAALQSKPVDFTVEVKAINELVLPKLDGDFAKKSGSFNTVSELKADIKKQLSLEKEQQSQREYENNLIRNIVAKMKVEIPTAMVDEHIERMENEEKQNLAYRGQTWDEHLKEEKVTAEMHRERHRPEAVERIKGGLALSEIAIKESLEVSEDELNQKIAELKAQYQDPAMRAEVDKPENRQDIVARILTEKTLAKLVEYSSK